MSEIPRAETTRYNSQEKSFLRSDFRQKQTRILLSPYKIIYLNMPEPRMERAKNLDLSVIAILMDCRNAATSERALKSLRRIGEAVQAKKRENLLQTIDIAIAEIEAPNTPMEEEQKILWLLAHAGSGDAKFVSNMRKLKTLIETTDPSLIEMENVAKLCRDNHIG